MLNLNTCADIVKEILDPPRQSLLEQAKMMQPTLCILRTHKMALTLESLWNLRNQVMHNRPSLWTVMQNCA